jgi:hypothetical protein
MRQIRPVGFHEKFVASGVYTYYNENGLERAISDNWSIHQLPDGSQKVRVDWETREDFWIDLIDALLTSQQSVKQIERFEISAYTTDWSSARIKANFIFFEDHVEVGRTYNDDPRENEEVNLPSEYVVYPGTCIFLGFAISQAALKNMDEVTIIGCYPWMDDHSAIRVMVSKWSVISAGYDILEIVGHNHDVRRYEQHISSEDIGIYWLDSYDVLLRAETRRSGRLLSYVVLTQYARRPEPRES